MEQPPDQEPLNIMVLTKEFDPDLEELGKDFTAEENKAKREAYKANPLSQVYHHRFRQL